LSQSGGRITTPIYWGGEKEERRRKGRGEGGVAEGEVVVVISRRCAIGDVAVSRSSSRTVMSWQEYTMKERYNRPGKNPIYNYYY